MSRLWIILSFLFLAAADASQVYICDSPYAACYHRTDSCEGLDLCNHEVRRIPLRDAQKQGKRPCKICYKQEHK